MTTRQMNDEEQYLDILEDILDHGHVKGDRTGTGTLSSFGRMMRFSLTDNKIPLLTTKKMFTKSFIHETLWFISGNTDVEYLKDHGIGIWDSWVNPSTATYRDLTDDEMVRDISKYLGHESKYWGVVPADKQTGIGTKMRFYNDEHDNGVVVAWQPGQTMEDLYRALLDKEPRALTGGSIGPGAYGAMWRDIEDTRLIPSTDESQYHDKGFQRICSLDDGRTLVTRRIDQLQNAIELLRNNPDSRRIIIHAFDNRMVDFCELPPCHAFFQFWSRELELNERVRWIEKNEPQLTEIFRYRLKAVAEGEIMKDHELWLDENDVPKRALSCMLYQRSADYPVGIPFNMAQYALLTHMVAQVTGMIAEEFVHVTADSHIYQNQADLVEEQLSRHVIEQETSVMLDPSIKEIDDFRFEDIIICGYGQHHPAIKYPVAV